MHQLPDSQLNWMTETLLLSNCSCSEVLFIRIGLSGFSASMQDFFCLTCAIPERFKGIRETKKAEAPKNPGSMDLFRNLLGLLRRSRSFHRFRELVCRIIKLVASIAVGELSVRDIALPASNFLHCVRQSFRCVGIDDHRCRFRRRTVEVDALMLGRFTTLELQSRSRFVLLLEDFLQFLVRGIVGRFGVRRYAHQPSLRHRSDCLKFWSHCSEKK
jgi:hypothetical protein